MRKNVTFFAPLEDIYYCPLNMEWIKPEQIIFSVYNILTLQ